MSFLTRSREELPPQKRPLVDLTTNGAGIPLKENWLERWCSVPKDFSNWYDEIYNFEVLEDDVFIVTFPKCGTTWMQEIAWLLLNDLDFKKAKETDLLARTVFLDLKASNSALYSDIFEKAAGLKRPRLLKSHLPAHALPHQIWKKKAKIIYCARNLKDVVVSFYHFHSALGTWRGTIDDFIDDLINRDIMYTPFWPHILDFWKMRREPQIFFTTFEHMKRDLGAVITELNEFLGKPALEADRLEELIEHLSFQRMKENQKTNPTKKIETKLNISLENFDFMRRGIVGAYRDELSEQNQRKLNEWTQKCLEGQSVTEKEIFGSDLF